MTTPTPFKQLDFSDEMDSVLERLDQAMAEYERTSYDAVEKEVTYKRRFHIGLVHAAADHPKMTAGMRESTALNECLDEYRAYRLAETSVKVSRETLVTLRTRLDALRTQAANARMIADKI